ncbi:MAG: L-rhamnose mutarotase [Planctomycetes bacterium]|nr:L-rhamnose mutarotase [Planctomycetota bacterium]
MIRKAFRMKVNAGATEEYERRHRPIWEELEKILFEHGVHTYSIYLDPESQHLFAYVEVENEDRWNGVAATDVCRRWWRFMRDIMPANADSSPVSRDLREVFHIERENAARGRDQGTDGAPVP